jgi:hypothetical protein
MRLKNFARTIRILITKLLPPLFWTRNIGSDMKNGNKLSGSM